MKNKRVEALKQALDDEVHGLWISDEMAVKILARVDAVTDAPSTSRCTPDPAAGVLPRVS